jgi:hypothetical protein
VNFQLAFLGVLKLYSQANFYLFSVFSEFKFK